MIKQNEIIESLLYLISFIALLIIFMIISGESIMLGVMFSSLIVGLYSCVNNLFFLLVVPPILMYSNSLSFYAALVLTIVSLGMIDVMLAIVKVVMYEIYGLYHE